MQMSEILRALKRRWYLLLVVVVAAVGAAAMLDKSMATQPTGTASLQVLVDSPVSALVNLQSDPTGLEARASVLAQAMTSNAVLASIAKIAGIPAGNLTAQGPFSGPGEVLDVPTPSEARGMQIASAGPQYHLIFVAQQNIPIVTVSVVGPTPVGAGKVANAVVPGTLAWLNGLATTDQVKSGSLVHLRQLGDAQAGEINSNSGKMIAIVGAVAILMLGSLFIVMTDRERREARRRKFAEMEQQLDDELVHEPGPALASVRSLTGSPGNDSTAQDANGRPRSLPALLDQHLARVPRSSSRYGEASSPTDTAAEPFGDHRKVAGERDSNPGSV